jgi:hypothetical protein
MYQPVPDTVLSVYRNESPLEENALVIIIDRKNRITRVIFLVKFGLSI